VDEGGALIDFAEVALHAVGMIPGLGAVCEKLGGAIQLREEFTSSPRTEMSESVIELGRYLIDLARLAQQMADETKRDLEQYMRQLADLVGVMGEAIKR
jgi:hypothetical protein